MPVAVPGALGYGSSTTGGRGGTVYRINTLSGSTAGPTAVGDGTYRSSLRTALAATGARIIVFEVSGEIVITGTLYADPANVTVFGETAPDDGITIRGWPTLVRGSNQIWRHIRFRVPHDCAAADANVLVTFPLSTEVTNLFFQNCSISGGYDEMIHLAHNTGIGTTNVTFQDCLIAESCIGLGSLVNDDSLRISYIRCLHALNSFRNPYSIEMSETLMVNCVNYDWYWSNSVIGRTGADAAYPRFAKINCVDKVGPNTYSTKKECLRVESPISAGARWYLDGCQLRAADNSVLGTDVVVNDGAITEWASNPCTATEYNLLSTNDAYTWVLARAGARPLNRDSMDARVIAHVTNGTAPAAGIPTGSGTYRTVEQFGGWATLTAASAALSLPSGWADIAASGYMVLEEWIHPMHNALVGEEAPQTWYVDSAATGANTGASWTDAWTSFSAIVWASVNAGDTILISGGTSGKTYSETLTVGKSGSAGALITISGATETGHNGLVTIDGGAARSYCVDMSASRAYIYLKNLKVMGATANLVRLSASDGSILEDITAYAEQQGIFVQDSTNVTVRRLAVTTPAGAVGVQVDGIYSQHNVGNIYEDCYIVISATDAAQHDDCIQSYNDTDLTIRGCYCEQDNAKTTNASCIYATVIQGIQQIYNNVCVNIYGNSGIALQLLPGVYGVKHPDGGTGTVEIYNNTTYTGGYFGIYTEDFADPVIKNNIIWYTGIGNGLTVTNAYGVTWSGTAANINYNLLYCPGSANPCKRNSTAYTWSGWQALGHDANGLNLDPELNSSLKPRVGSPVIDVGESLAAIFTTDKDGVSRPQAAAWDMGAYEGEALSESLAAVVAATSTVTGVLSVAGGSATARYVRGGATGSGSGLDWTNAYPSLPTSFVRGYTYYVATGNVVGGSSSRTLSTALSGTLYVTIKKATGADHGTDTGWNSSYGVGTATLPRLTISTAYWRIDGVYRGTQTTGHGFFINAPTGSKGITIGGGNYSRGTIMQFIEIAGGGDDADTGMANDLIYSLPSGNANDELQIRYCYLHDAGRCPILARATSYLLMEHCYVQRNQSTATQHSEGVSAYSGTHYWTVRYNFWEDCEGTGVVVFAGNGWKIYGNVFVRTNAQGTNPSISNGAVATWTAEQVNNAKVHQNTFIGYTSASYNAGVGFISSSPGTGNEAYNNLWYNCDTVYHANVTHNYNWYYNCGGSHSAANNEVGIPGIFVDYSGMDYHLASNTSSGVALAAEYGHDMDGEPRSTWSRGAFEYVNPLAEPKQLEAVVTAAGGLTGVLAGSVTPEVAIGGVSGVTASLGVKRGLSATIGVALIVLSAALTTAAVVGAWRAQIQASGWMKPVGLYVARGLGTSSGGEQYRVVGTVVHSDGSTGQMLEVQFTATARVGQRHYVCTTCLQVWPRSQTVFHQGLPYGIPCGHSDPGELKSGGIGNT